MVTRTDAVVTLLLAVVAAVLAAAVTIPATPIYPAPLDDGSDIAAAHADALETAGDFTYRDTTRIRINGTLETNRTTIARFDTETGVGLVERYGDGFGQLAFYDDGAGSTFERSVSPAGTVRYGQPQDVATQVSRFSRPGITALLRDVDYTYEGTTRAGGVVVHEYAATSPDQIDDIVGPDFAGPQYDTEVDVRVFISADGVVRRMEILLVQRDGTRTRTLNSTLAYSAVGTTTVPEPDWVATARNRTGPQR